MSAQVVVAVLTALIAVVVVATRLSPARGAGGRATPRWVADVHTVAGLLGLAGWTGYLVTGQLEVGIVSLFLLWLAALAGLLVLSGTLPERGRHATRDRRGPRVSLVVVPLVSHLGVLAAVALFTWAYLVAAV